MDVLTLTKDSSVFCVWLLFGRFKARISGGMRFFFGPSQTKDYEIGKEVKTAFLMGKQHLKVRAAKCGGVLKLKLFNLNEQHLIRNTFSMSSTGVIPRCISATLSNLRHP